MFRYLDRSSDELEFTFDGRSLRASHGTSLAAALLAAGVTRLRTHPVDLSPRAPLCMMGICFECLVTIDGRINRQACLEPVREGMRVESQQGRMPLIEEAV